MSNEERRADFAALTKAVEKLTTPWKAAFFASNLLWAAVCVLLRRHQDDKTACGLIEGCKCESPTPSRPGAADRHVPQTGD